MIAKLPFSKRAKENLKSLSQRREVILTAEY